MAIWKTDYAKGIKPAPIADGAGDLMSIRIAYTFPASSGVANGDLLEVFPLPEDHVPVDVFIDYDALGTSVTSAIGIVNAAGTGIDTSAASGGAAWIAATATATAGLTRASTSAVMRTVPQANYLSNGTGNRRMIGWLIAGATPVTTAVTIGLTLHYRSASYGV